MKRIHTEQTNVQAFMTKYLMKEEELIREAAKVKEEAKNLRRAQGKYTAEVNSLSRRLTHAKE